MSQAGVVTISGSSSGSANAQYQGCCEGGAQAQAAATAAFTLTGSYSFAIQVTITINQVGQTSVGTGVEITGVGGQLFEATGGASGVLPAGGHGVNIGALAVASARLERLSDAADKSVSFTLTLTPQ